MATPDLVGLLLSGGPARFTETDWQSFLAGVNPDDAPAIRTAASFSPCRRRIGFPRSPGHGGAPKGLPRSPSGY